MERWDWTMLSEGVYVRFGVVDNKTDDCDDCGGCDCEGEGASKHTMVLMPAMLPTTQLHHHNQQQQE